MTVAYKISAKQEAFNAFVDKIKQSGKRQVDMIVEEPVLFTGNKKYHLNRVWILSGSENLRVVQYASLERNGDDKNEVLISIYKNKQRVLRKAVETAEELQKIGLEARVDKKTVGEINELITVYDGVINDWYHRE